MSKTEQQNVKKNINVNAQYVKDLSFESPNSPASLTFKDKPKVDFSLDIEARAFEENVFEVVLSITAKATIEEKNVFVIDLKYAAVFSLQNISEEEKEFVLLVTCPNIIFPYARRILSDTTRDGGFQPLMLDPVDFTSLFMQRKMQQENLEAESVN